MTNKINLITGETYNLGELFSGSRRIIIPDLQRDYCWGNKSTDKGAKSLAEGFMETLLDQFEAHRYGQLNLGLLYGYESPADYVQLCDGQQRVTTLFLLLGMLNRWAGNDRYRHYLMSDFEFYDDDHEPYLQYSIRESSLYFMSDLVYNFFSNARGGTMENVNSIYNGSTGQSCSWFYGEYINDPSIMSMLSCLRSIECMKARIIVGDDPDRIEALMEFLVSRLTFIYYDMGNRANGEETFVVINTTGEPLSATENLKPLVINADINQSADNLSHNVCGKDLPTPKAWEEMENFFWRIRRKDSFDTADFGFNEFLRWVTLLETYESADHELFKQNARENFEYNFPYKEIPVSTIVRIFNVFVKLRNEYAEFFDPASLPGQGEKLEQKQLFVLLPLLAYLLRHPQEDRRQMIRFKKWLENLVRVDNVLKSVNELLSDVIRIGYTITDPIEILDMDRISTTILTEEERFKLSVIKECPDDSSRRDLEESICAAQDMRVDSEGQLLFSGEIRTMLLWATAECAHLDHTFDATRFKHYLYSLKRLLKTGHHTVNDDIRRALLAWRYQGLPYGKSYGWERTWKHILASDTAGFRRFIDTVDTLGIDHIFKLDSTGNPIAMYPQLLAYSDKKNFDNWSGSGLNICKSSYAKPIPVHLAAIMARMGASVERYSTQKCGDWYVDMIKDGTLVITPLDADAKGIDEIRVTSVDDGAALHYHVQAPAFLIDITLPLSSDDVLLSRLYPAASRKKKSKKARSHHGKLHHTKSFKALRKS